MNLIEYEDLKDVVLIGYSYSGTVVTVARQILAFIENDATPTAAGDGRRRR